MAIACKVKELLETQGAITPAPGQSPDARMVLSRTGKQPLCSHAIAAAHSSGKLSITGCCLTSKRKTTAQCDQACNRNDSERKRAKGVKLQLGGKPPRWLTTGANSIPSRLPLSQSVLQGHSCHLCLFGVTLLHLLYIFDIQYHHRGRDVLFLLQEKVLQVEDQTFKKSAIYSNVSVTSKLRVD